MAVCEESSSTNASFRAAMKFNQFPNAITDNAGVVPVALVTVVLLVINCSFQLRASPPVIQERTYVIFFASLL